MGCLYEDIYFEQTADIYFPKDEVWKPIGDVFLNLPFKGIYNGNGYSLINIYCYNQYASVFALLDGVVKNLLIENGFFYGSTIGSIVSHGTKNGIIENVVNNSMVKGVHRCGGICDNFSGTIKSCKNIGNIIGNYDYTILAGITSYGNGKIINCECDILPLVNELTFSGNIISNNKMNELGTTLVGILLSFLIVFTIIASIYCFVKNIKKTLSGIIFPVTSFLVIFAIIYNFVNVYISTPITAGVLQFHNFNKKENQNTDVLFLGGSTMSCNFELSELWKKYGIAGFCGGAGISSIEDSYFRLIKFQKIHPVKNVVVEISGTRFKYNYGNTEQTLNNVSGMPFCLDKIKYICSAIEPSKRNAYLTKLPLFHENWKKINKWYFLRSSELGDDDKGTWTVMHGNFYKPVLLDANNYVDYQFLNDKQELFLKKIISFCVNNEINLVFLKSVDAARWQNQSVWNTVEVIADEFSVPLLDFNYLDDTIGIDSDDFYYDDRHLNVLGARKNTQYLAEFIRKYFNLDNHKDSIEYKSWEKFSENRESLYLKSIYNTEEYLFELARDEKLVYMIPYRISNNVVSYLQQDFPELELINSVPLTLEYGKVSTVLLGEKSVDISKNYDKLDIISNGDKKRISITKSGLILLSCDIVNEKIADIVLISDDNKKLIRF